MQINAAYNTSTNITSRVASPANNNQPTFREVQNDNTVAINTPVSQQASVDEAQVIRYEINHLLQQFSEWTRVATESKRMELLYNLLLKSNQETSDLFGMIMEIARRIMKGESVTVDDMRFVFNHNPQLLFVLVMFKDQSTSDDYKERRRVRERRRKDRRAEARKQAHNVQYNIATGIRSIESINVSAQSDWAKDKHSQIELAMVKKLYDNASVSKNNTTSIDELKANLYNIAI